MISKRLLKIFLVISALVVLFSPLYMYFSYDVYSLKEEYPHPENVSQEEVDFEIRPGKPKSWTPLKHVSRYAKWAIVFSEDWAFYDHQGIDVNQIKAAVADMVKVTRFRGASTITQQMVKNVFLSDSRTLWRKLHEIILAQKVEKVLTKDRILEIYLNCIEFGPGIYGIRAASYHYFKKHPSALKAREGAFLAMLLPSPKRYYVSFEKRKLTKFAKLRIKAILKKMKMGKVISPDLFQFEVRRRFLWER